MKTPIPAPLTVQIGDATALVRRGRLLDATAAIQCALRGAGRDDVGVATPAVTRAESMLALDRPNIVTPVSSPRAEGVRDKPSRGQTVSTRFLRDEYTAASGARAYKLFVPGGVTGTPRPLIVMLHGCTQDPDDFAAGTRMNLLAQERGVVVLYPAQAARSNVSKCWNWFHPSDQRRGGGEPELLAEMTRHIIATQAIDPARVYVAGLSAGGAMAAILGREYPDLFAAVGVHSGLAPGAAHDVASAFAVMKSGAVVKRGTLIKRGTSGSPLRAAASTEFSAVAPMIVFHGDHDATVHPNNAVQVLGVHVEDLERHDESGVAGRGYTRSIYTAPDGRVRAEHWRLHGGGHAWSGGSAEGSYTDLLGPDASREMLRFFLDRTTGANH